MIVKPEDIASQNATQKVGLQDCATQVVDSLHVINGEHYSGAERVQDLLALNLPKFGFAADFVCVKPRRFAEYRNSKSRLFEQPMRHNLDWKCIRQISQLACENGYQIIHAHTPRSLLVASWVARNVGVPLIYHVHSPVGKDSTRSLRNRINTFVEKLCLRRVKKMICVSRSLRDYMIGLGHADDRLAVVQNGVPSLEVPYLRTPPTGTWTLGTVALFRPRKGIEVLLEALAKLRTRGVDVCLRAVGPFETDEYQAEILALVEQLGIQDLVEWTGFCRNVDEELKKMDLFVLPSLFGEGLPMVVLEAMAASVPVIASRVEGIPEAVRDRTDGLIFEAGSSDDLADKIESLVGDDARWLTMSRSAEAQQRENLSAESMARGVAEVYRSVLG